MKLYKDNGCWFVLYRGERWICGTLEVALLTIDDIRKGILK